MNVKRDGRKFLKEEIASWSRAQRDAHTKENDEEEEEEWGRTASAV